MKPQKQQQSENNVRNAHISFSFPYVAGAAANLSVLTLERHKMTLFIFWYRCALSGGEKKNQSSVLCRAKVNPVKSSFDSE